MFDNILQKLLLGTNPKVDVRQQKKRLPNSQVPVRPDGSKVVLGISNPKSLPPKSRISRPVRIPNTQPEPSQPMPNFMQRSQQLFAQPSTPTMRGDMSGVHSGYGLQVQQTPPLPVQRTKNLQVRRLFNPQDNRDTFNSLY